MQIQSQRSVVIPLPAIGKKLTAAIVLIMALAGCSAIPDSALVDPAKYEFYNCVQLKIEMGKLQTRGHELLQLRAKASRDPGGAAVSAVTYEPEYKMLRGNMGLVAEQSKHKDCSPPIVVAAEFTTD